MRDIINHHISAIAKKELRTYFNSPTAYIVLAVFLLLWEFLFFNGVFLIGEASLRILFDYLPWLFLLFIPAITMGSISQEKSDGTIEFLLTHPVNDRELIIGKFFGCLAFAALTLLFIFPIAFSFSLFGNIDWGVIWGQYLGSVFLAAVLISLGISISALFASQISSLLVAATASFFYIIAGFDFVTGSMPGFLVPVFERLSVLSHFASMARGIIDIRDLWYFVSAITIFLNFAYLLLLKRRFGNRRSLYRKYQIGMMLFIGIAILTNIVGSRIPGRIDLTQDRLYTITNATKKTLDDLNDVVNISLFASNELPAQLQPVLRDIKDTLRDYETLGKGNIVVSYKDPSDQKIGREAAALGIREVQFNVVGQGEFQIKTGFLGLAVSYAGKNETIPFVQTTDDLEYQLTSFIKKLTVKDKKEIAFLSGYGEKNLSRDYRLLSAELEKQFKINNISINDNNLSIASTTAALVVAGPTQKIDDNARSAMRDFITKGGSVLFLIDAISINQDTLSSSQNQENFADFLKEYGVEVQDDLAYDLRSNASVRFSTGQGGFFSYTLPYPFWARVLASDKTSPITAHIESIVLPWASSITLNDAKLKEQGFITTKILSTTRFGGKVKAGASLAPDQKLPQENLGEQLVAISIESANLKENGKKARMIIVGDSDFMSDQFAQNSPESVAFGIGALSWLGQEESLASIRIKQKTERRLLFENATQVSMVKYGNLILAFLVPAGYGLFRLMRRRGLRRFTYSSNP